MNYDYSKLKGKIKEKFDTQSNFAKTLGCSEKSLSLKLNNERNFTQREIDNCIKLLQLDDIKPYFFKKLVHISEHKEGD